MNYLNIIEVENLCFDYISYDEDGKEVGRNPVLKDVSLSVPEGQFLAVLGHNGCGKSTLAKHFNAILMPTSGKVTVAGIDTSDEDKLFDIRQTVGMVFQNPDNQLVATIVEEDVAFAPENMGIPQPEIRQRVDDALKQVDMYEYREHAPHQLSGGQKQRVAIAGVIAMQPRCIVMDEPTAMLDPKGRREVMETIHTLNREKGITVVLITHYMDEAAQADRVVVMDGGNIIMDDVPKKIFSQVKKLRSVGLDVPQVTELCEELREKGVDISTEIIGEQECAEALFSLTKGRSAEIPPAKEAAEDDKRPVVLECDKVTYKYSIGTPFEKTAVNSVDLKIRQGEFVGIIGHTGSGKSTLIQHFDGLVKPTSGRVLVDGADIWSKDVNIRGIRFKVGLVFQYSEHQLFEETVYQDIAFGPKNLGLSDEETAARVKEAMRLVHLDYETYAKRSPFALSGGQMRRVAIAGVIAMEPECIVLDEATAMLDPIGRQEVLSAVHKLNREKGITVVLITHHMNEAMEADRAIVMNHGHIAVDGTPREVFARVEDLRALGLAAPDTVELLYELRSRGIDIPLDAMTVEECADAICHAFSGEK